MTSAPAASSGPAVRPEHLRLIEDARHAALGESTATISDAIEGSLATEPDPIERGVLHLARALIHQGAADPGGPAADARSGWELLRGRSTGGLAAYAAACAAGLAQRCGDIAEAIDLAVDAMVLLADGGVDEAASVRTANALAVVFGQLSAFDLAVDLGERAFRGRSADQASHEIVTYTLAFATIEGTWATRRPRSVRWFDLAVEAAEWLGTRATSAVGRGLIAPAVRMEVAILGDDTTAIAALVGGDDGSDPPVYEVGAARLVAWHRLVRAAAARRIGRPEVALGLLDLAVPTLAEVGDEHRLARALTERARVHAALGDGDAALTDALALAETARAGEVELVGRLAVQISRRAELERARSELRTQAEQLARQAAVDVVTGVGSRRWLEVRLDELSRRDGGGAVVVIDLDWFKGINDRFGHAVGDQVLACTGALLADAAGPDDLVARYGGEEFVVVLPGATGERGRELAEQLRSGVATHDWGAVAAGLEVTLSAGVAHASLAEVRHALREADMALYQAKRSGRDRVVVATGLSR